MHGHMHMYIHIHIMYMKKWTFRNTGLKASNPSFPMKFHSCESRLVLILFFRFFHMSVENVLFATI